MGVSTWKRDCFSLDSLLQHRCITKCVCAMPVCNKFLVYNPFNFFLGHPNQDLQQTKQSMCILAFAWTESKWNQRPKHYWEGSAHPHWGHSERMAEWFTLQLPACLHSFFQFYISALSGDFSAYLVAPEGSLYFGGSLLDNCLRDGFILLLILSWPDWTDLWCKLCGEQP